LDDAMATVEEILDAAQSLPSAERAKLIHALWASVTADDWPPPSDEYVTEFRRRSEAYDAGQMSGSPWSEVRQRARRKAGLDE